MSPGDLVQFVYKGQVLVGRLVYVGPRYAFTRALPNEDSDLWAPGEFASWRAAMHDKTKRKFTAPSKNGYLVRVGTDYYSPDEVMPVA